MISLKYCTSFFLLFFSASLYGQENNSGSIAKNTTFEFKNDTLYSATGLKLYAGQQFIIGNAAGEDGQYRSIISSKAALVPSIWGQDPRYEYAIENYVDSKKNKEKLKKTLGRATRLPSPGSFIQKQANPFFTLPSFLPKRAGIAAT